MYKIISALISFLSIYSAYQNMLCLTIVLSTGCIMVSLWDIADNKKEQNITLNLIKKREDDINV